ncbi:hypothetical protein GGTG_01874 [Gaeumannomyces tritici R3-111a-1]|uniref:Uncharacterized protein n=1 Tax=Gaeumannomyces tritici (strain R3-111a-1) TaxID=644352 RepID=J3NKT3_GAET3|nr:hypothetical protein GGTG_01874 [Gaeumannomyces tritici R3-111a-1]EJT81900.1 hypothetical protein GGTG_01874 [Gaeumannomyces tritici R3-111a-1]
MIMSPHNHPWNVVGFWNEIVTCTPMLLWESERSYPRELWSTQRYGREAREVAGKVRYSPGGGYVPTHHTLLGRWLPAAMVRPDSGATRQAPPRLRYDRAAFVAQRKKKSEKIRQRIAMVPAEPSQVAPRLSSVGWRKAGGCSAWTPGRLDGATNKAIPS